MVAYNFQARFAPAIEARAKRCTIRAPRRGRARHARPGEAMQLYVGLRRPGARKLLTPDPACAAVADIVMHVGDTVTGIVLGGRRLTLRECEALARADGFANLAGMAEFWRRTHGRGPFAGVLLRWG